MSAPHQIIRVMAHDLQTNVGFWSCDLKAWVCDYADATTFSSRDEARQLADDLNSHMVTKCKPYRAAAIQKEPSA